MIKILVILVVILYLSSALLMLGAAVWQSRNKLTVKNVLSKSAALFLISNLAIFELIADKAKMYSVAYDIREAKQGALREFSHV